MKWARACVCMCVCASVCACVRACISIMNGGAMLCQASSHNSLPFVATELVPPGLGAHTREVHVLSVKGMLLW